MESTEANRAAKLNLNFLKRLRRCCSVSFNPPITITTAPYSNYSLLQVLEKRGFRLTCTAGTENEIDLAVWGAWNGTVGQETQIQCEEKMEHNGLGFRLVVTRQQARIQVGKGYVARQKSLDSRTLLIRTG